MDKCDVLIVGGGPAGSSCAWKLRRAGIDVLVVDKEEFPRHKVCAGWITPSVLEELDFDTDDYRKDRVLQPITRFITGMIDGPEVETDYDRTVSFGIRRCEFDDYLLRRSNARKRLGTPFRSLKRGGSEWILNDQIRAPIVVGAAGHFCPVARQFSVDDNSRQSGGDGQPTVLAQEAEFEMTVEQQRQCSVMPDRPELFFCPDVKGYGWIFRKENFINIGMGREGEPHLSNCVRQFVQKMISRRKIPAILDGQFHGHAYRLRTTMPRETSAEGILLIGDSAGLAAPESGEGIRPAIESGLLAAASILESDRNDRSQLAARYRAKLRARFDDSNASSSLRRVPTPIRLMAARWLMTSHWFAHRVLLDRWFLNLDRPLLRV